MSEITTYLHSRFPRWSFAISVFSSHLSHIGLTDEERMHVAHAIKDENFFHVLMRKEKEYDGEEFVRTFVLEQGNSHPTKDQKNVSFLQRISRFFHRFSHQRA